MSIVEPYGKTKSIKSKWQSHAKGGTLEVLAVLQVIEEPQAVLKALSHET